MRLEFVVEGSKGDHYLATFEREGTNLNAFCTCQAGENGLYCKHRFALMDGDVSSLISGNVNDVERLKTMIQGTDIESAYTRVQDATKAFDAAKKELGTAKKHWQRQCVDDHKAEKAYPDGRTRH